MGDGRRGVHGICLGRACVSSSLQLTAPLPLSFSPSHTVQELLLLPPIQRAGSPLHPTRMLSAIYQLIRLELAFERNQTSAEIALRGLNALKWLTLRRLAS